MNPSKITLSNGDHDEYQLGIFTQGVVFEFDLRGQVDVIDVASGDVVAIQDDEGWRWGREIGPYSKLFVQSYDGDIEDVEVHLIRDEEGLSTRAKNCLIRGGLKTLEEVTQKTKQEMIMFWPNFGKRCADEVEMALQAHGLDYREET